jgi:3-oxoacyl-[acyl-carrier protein] reductase
MDLQLHGKRVLVTGSSSGIGRGIARFLAQEGCSIAVHGRSPDRVAAVVAEIRAAGGLAVPVLGEMANDDSVQQVASAALEALGGIDVLVGNAGGRAGQGDGSWEATEPEDFLRTYQLNVASNVRLVKALVPGMKARGWGRIILISSVAGAQPKPNTVPDYAASKLALVNVGLSLAKWLQGTGITVNTISPGVVESEAIRAFMRRTAQAKGWPLDWPSLREKAVREVFRVPVGRIGRPEDVAAMVALLASDLGGFCHGANIRVDGGAVGVVQ